MSADGAAAGRDRAGGRADDRVVRLIGRSSSHFTRVARMAAHELAVPVVFEVVPDLLSVDPAAYGGHPSLKIPILHDGDVVSFGTEHICRRLVAIAGRTGDPRIVLAAPDDDALVANAQEIVWTAMLAQVQLVAGVQLARLPADNPYFAKAAQGLRGSLGWLDEHLAAILAALPAERAWSSLELALYCLLEHIAFRSTLSLARFAALHDFAATIATRPSARSTRYAFDRTAARPASDDR